MKTTTLGEWGRKLPLGQIEGDNLNREFSIRELDFGVERAIQKSLPRDGSQSVSERVSHVLARLLTSLGGKKLDPDKKPAETEALLQRCWMGDILYMWIWTRRESCGPELQIPVPCANPRCNFIEEPSPTFNLDTFDVMVPETPAELRGMWTLKFPYEIRGQRVKAFRLQPPLWSTFMDSAILEGDISGKLLTNGICGTDVHESIMLTDPELNKLKRPDYQGIAEAIDKLTFGTKLVVENDCPRCKMKGFASLNWSYENFFS